MVWTRFMGMLSGGSLKEPQQYILIEAPEEESKVIFYNRFGHNPERVTCTCCGDDYSISEHGSLAEATAFERGCRYAYFRPDGTECPEEEGWVPLKGTPEGYTQGYVDEAGGEFSWNKTHISLDKYIKKPEVLVIPADQIRPEDRKGSVPQQGYVWLD